MSILATHDSLTAYPVKTRWLKPFNFLCRCQDKTLDEQYGAGARSFDLRFAKWRGEWYAAHGAMLYDIQPGEAIYRLRRYSYFNKETIYFRVLCEDTFYRKSDVKELEDIIDKLLSLYSCEYLHPLYVRSKRTWETVREYPANARCADYPNAWDKKYTPSGMAEAVRILYETKTSDDKLNFVACYSSKYIPRFTAKILTKIALKKKWKENDVPVVDFI
jgi:hypothetical protein